MIALLDPITKESLWLNAEPNWPLLAAEFGEDYDYNCWVRLYCDLETKSTFAVSVGNALDTLFGDKIEWVEEPDHRSWVGYEWAYNGECFTLAYGEDACNEWWAIDDILFGAFDQCYLGCVDPDTHCVVSVQQIVDHYTRTTYLANQNNLKRTIEYWWHPLSPAEEVQYGLTQAELQEEAEAAQKLLSEL